MYPFTAGTKYIQYDPTTHRATLQDDPARAHLASYVNAARVGTFLRPGVEQFHGAIVQKFKVSGFSRVEVVRWSGVQLSVM
jgi:hypothetical protein